MAGRPLRRARLNREARENPGGEIAKLMRGRRGGRGYYPSTLTLRFSPIHPPGKAWRRAWVGKGGGTGAALYRPTAYPNDVSRIFIGDSYDHGPNVVAFYDKEGGDLVEASVVDYDTRDAAWDALISGRWYSQLPDWITDEDYGD